MGKRVNLEDLASEEIDAPAPTTSIHRTSPDPAADETSAEPSEQGPRFAPVHRVALNPLNKRPEREDEEIAEAADTMRDEGVLQALTVCSASAYLAHYPQQEPAIGQVDWVVLMGNRRLQAAHVAGLTEVPIVVADDKVAAMYKLMLIENLEHRGLPPVNEAEAMAEVLAQEGISQRELSRRIGKSHPYITQRLALLGLISPLRHAFESGEITIERAREFGELSEERQREIVAAGKPYQYSPRGNGVTGRTAARRSIRVSTPAVAAESLRSRFSHAELTELIQLLTENESTSAPEGAEPDHTSR